MGILRAHFSQHAPLPSSDIPRRHTVNNYFNTLPLRIQLEELGKCRFMDRDPNLPMALMSLRGKTNRHHWVWCSGP